MLALVLNGTPRVTELPAPVPAAGEALVRVVVAGVCNTDIELLKGYMGFSGVPGHEFVGIVEHASNSHLIGKRVVGEINCVCRRCRYCQNEMPHHCLDRTVLGIYKRNGAFAEYLPLPEDNLHMVPDGVPDEVAVFTEPTAAAFRIGEQLDIAPNDRIVVLGDGKLGQLVAQVLYLRTKRIVCVGKHPWKLELLNRLRIPTSLTGDPVEPGADIVVEATGAPDGLSRAFELVRPEGVIVLKTTVAGPSKCSLNHPVINEVTIVGSRCGPFRPALEALTLGTVEVRSMISETLPLREAVLALQRATDPSIMKVLIRMQ